MSAQNAILEAIEDVIAMCNEAQAMATVRRGALATGAGITCEIGPSVPDTHFMNKDIVVPVDLTFNGKSDNLKTVLQAMDDIHYNLTRRTVYPAGVGWEIVDIVDATLPQVIGREPNNDWLLASSVTVRLHIM
jgi:hypothetical protein